MDKTRPTGPAPTIRTGSLAFSPCMEFVFERSLLWKYLAGYTLTLELFLLILVTLLISPRIAMVEKLKPEPESRWKGKNSEFGP